MFRHYRCGCTVDGESRESVHGWYSRVGSMKAELFESEASLSAVRDSAQSSRTLIIDCQRRVHPKEVKGINYLHHTTTFINNQNHHEQLPITLNG
jgi:hypothetical protein